MNLRKRHLSKVLLGIISAGFTLFVFMNTYEVVFNQDIVLASSVRKMAAQQTISGVVREFDIKQNTNTANEIRPLDGFAQLEIAAIHTNVQLEEGRRIDNLWYQRPSMAHYVELNKNTKGAVIDYLVYTNKSWQTIPSPDQIEEGMEVKLYSKNGTSSLLQVAEKKLLPIDRSFVVNKSEGRQVLLLIEDTRNKSYYGYSLTLKR